ncbi:MAG: hypothetical protein SGI73_18530 [Chloroflexota bacterium]|nr:hypothetical protein [Chloroflexota bacterium]
MPSAGAYTCWECGGRVEYAADAPFARCTYCDGARGVEAMPPKHAESSGKSPT